MTAWKKANPDWRRGNMLKNSYGLTHETFASLLASQDGLCAICGIVPGDSLGRSGQVDHDHATGEIRGILCGPCNAGLGNFRDDPALLEAAIEYLKGIR